MNSDKIYYVAWKSAKVKLLSEFTDGDRSFCIVKGIDREQDYPFIISKSDLGEWEKSNAYAYQKAQKEEYDLVEAKKKELVKEVALKALKQLESRMRFNIAFSTDSKMTGVGLYFVDEFKKMIDNYDWYGIKELAHGKKE